MRHELTACARSWLLTVLGWKVRYVRVLAINHRDGTALVRAKGREWRMGSGCLK